MPLAKVLQIDDLMEKFPYEISGGQKQRTAIARALITEPRLVLADEPTGALDSRASNELLNMFEQINRAGQTILMVTHSTKAASHAGRVLFIKDGIVYHQIYRGDVQKHFRNIDRDGVGRENTCVIPYISNWHDQTSKRTARFIFRIRWQIY